MHPNHVMIAARWMILMPVPLIVAACLALPDAQDRPEDEGQKNLAAIREVLSQYPFNSRSSVQRSAGSSPAPSQEVPRPPAVSLPGDHPLLEPSPYSYSRGVPITPNRSSAQDLKVTIPWKPPKPQALVPEEPFRPVPPYFHPTPIKPDYPGTLRCVPDLYGGQRCR
jgi:hypothetical protein